MEKKIEVSDSLGSKWEETLSFSLEKYMGNNSQEISDFISTYRTPLSTNKLVCNSLHHFLQRTPARTFFSSDQKPKNPSLPLETIGAKILWLDVLTRNYGNLFSLSPKQANTLFLLGANQQKLITTLVEGCKEEICKKADTEKSKIKIGAEKSLSALLELCINYVPTVSDEAALLLTHLHLPLHSLHLKESFHQCITGAEKIIETIKSWGVIVSSSSPSPRSTIPYLQNIRTTADIINVYSQPPARAIPWDIVQQQLQLLSKQDFTLLRSIDLKDHDTPEKMESLLSFVKKFTQFQYQENEELPLHLPLLLIRQYGVDAVKKLQTTLKELQSTTDSKLKDCLVINSDFLSALLPKDLSQEKAVSRIIGASRSTIPDNHFSNELLFAGTIADTLLQQHEYLLPADAIKLAFTCTESYKKHRNIYTSTTNKNLLPAPLECTKDSLLIKFTQDLAVFYKGKPDMFTSVWKKTVKSLFRSHANPTETEKRMDTATYIKKYIENNTLNTDTETLSSHCNIIKIIEALRPPASQQSTRSRLLVAF